MRLNTVSSQLVGSISRRLFDSVAHRSETDVRRAEIDFLRLSRRRPVARTVVGGTQVGPAFDDFAGELSRREAKVHQAGSLWFRRGYPWVAAAGLSTSLVRKRSTLTHVLACTPRIGTSTEYVRGPKREHARKGWAGSNGAGDPDS